MCVSNLSASGGWEGRIIRGDKGTQRPPKIIRHRSPGLIGRGALAEFALTSGSISDSSDKALAVGVTVNLRCKTLAIENRDRVGIGSASEPARSSRAFAYMIFAILSEPTPGNEAPMRSLFAISFATKILQ
jgi:hypothetical protein